MFIQQLAYLVFFGRRVRALLRPGAGASAGGGEQDRLILSAASFAVGAVSGRRKASSETNHGPYIATQTAGHADDGYPAT
jgi:hypothetical protein